MWLVNLFSHLILLIGQLCYKSYDVCMAIYFKVYCYLMLSVWLFKPMLMLIELERFPNHKSTTVCLLVRIKKQFILLLRLKIMLWLILCSDCLAPLAWMFHYLLLSTVIIRVLSSSLKTLFPISFAFNLCTYSPRFILTLTFTSCLTNYWCSQGSHHEFVGGYEEIYLYFLV